MAAPAAGPAVPFASRVTDAADVLGADDESALAALSERFQRETCHQLLFLTLPDLGGRDIAAVGRDLGNAWGIGRRGADDGVLILVAPAERRIRIEVGRGLERQLTNADAQRIIEERIRPELEPEERFGTALCAGGASIFALLAPPPGAPLPDCAILPDRR